MHVLFRCYLLVWVLVAAVFPTAATAAATTKLTAAEREYLNHKGSITFISQTSYPPFEFVDERFERSERRGMMIELAQWISSEFGFHARFIDASFADAQTAVLDGTADVLTSFFYSDKRNETFDFTQTIFPVPASIFVIANRTDISGIDDLRDKRIAMQRGDFADDFLRDRNIPFNKLPTSNFAEATTQVINGEADAVIGDEQIVLYYLYSNNLQQLLKIVGEPLYTGLNSMAVKEGNLLLQSILNKGIDHALASGMLERLNRKWLGTPLAAPPDTLDLRALWPYGAGVLAVLVAIMVWNVQLRRTVAARTAALRRNEQRLASVIKGTRAGTWEWNLATGECFYNDRWVQMLGYELAELETPTDILWRQFIHPEDLPRAEERIKRHCQGELDFYRCEIRMRHKDGHWVWIVERGSVCERGPDGSALILAGTSTDISERIQHDEELRLKSQVLDQISDMVTVTDINGVITYVNRAATQLLGRPSHEVVGRFPREVYANPLEKAQEILEHTLANGSWRGDVINRTADGSEQLIDLRTSTILCDNGKVIALCGISTDITQWHVSQRALEESESKYRRLFASQQVLLDNIRTQIWYLTGEHQYGEVNQAHADFFGVSKEELAFKDMYDIMPAEAVEICRISNVHIFNTGESTLTEELLTDSHGNIRLMQIHKTPKLGEDGRVEYVVCSAEDITERKAAELALKEKTKEMEQFVYIVSHDLKSPLITIKTFLKLLQEDIRTGDQEQIATNLAYLNGATTKIESLLGALLQLSRVGNIRSLPQDVATSTLVTDCLTALAGPLQQHQVKVTVNELPATLHGSPLHFGQIWQNLIENASKYMGYQAQPQIEIGCLQQDTDQVFYVRDNGMGIAAAHHQHIFGIFTQLSRSSEGTGLGLALVKKIVTIYQGHIWVESAGEGEGSCFKFTLPTAVRLPD